MRNVMRRLTSPQSEAEHKRRHFTAADDLIRLLT